SNQTPQFGGFELRTITAGALAMALLGMAQGAVVMSGGINMSVGAIMVLINCVSARLMENTGFAVNVLIAVGCLVLAAAISALMGWIINVSGIPDIVVTLALSFTITGSAWIALQGPGGGIDANFQNILVGSMSNPWPSIIFLLVVLGAIWWPFAHSRAGLSMYAMGSSKQAAFLAGVNVPRARIQVYLVSGVLAGLAGVATTAYTGGGDPTASIGMSVLMTSVAAAVLGGVALSGGVGGLVGPVLAAVLLGLIFPILMGLGVNPNWSQVVQGIVIIVVVLLGGATQMRRRAK
ncbi:MAG: ABC transporter permease, partial [Micrococcales bacterium]|nr:ABC transporter permease [Micrococcales bacterium]